MRTLLIAGLILCSTANAKVVNVECPKSYPPQNTALTTTLSGHKGKGLVEKSELVNFGIFGGDFGEKQEFVLGRSKKVKGGTDMVGFSSPTWLVCYYRNGVSWWEQVDAADLHRQGKIKDGCVIQSRDNGKSIRLICQ